MFEQKLRIIYRCFLNKLEMKKAVSKAARKLENVSHDKPAVIIMCYSFYGGGAERVACRLAEGLSSEYEVIMLGAEEKERCYLTDDKIPVIYMPFFHGTYDQIYTEYANFAKWVKEKARATASISFMYMMNKANVMSAGSGKVICSERNNPKRREPEHLEEIEKLYEKADHVVFQTATVQSLFSDKVKDHSSIIPNPVQVPCLHVGGEKRIVNIGRLNRQKNQTMLIRAFAGFHDIYPEYSLYIYGEGELQSELENLAVSLDVDTSVVFAGNVTDVHEQVKNAEMFVLSSDFEGMSNALLECMMMGMPCISTACEGSSDVIKSGENGLLTKTGDEEGLFKAMCILAKDSNLQRKIGENARLCAREFEAENVMKKWKKTIEEA